MPKPLPNRHCVVVSNKEPELFVNAHDVINGNFLIQSLRVLENQNINKTIWIIGGAKLINSTKHLFREIHLTLFDNEYNCDVKLDIPDLLKDFHKQSEHYGRNKIFTVWKHA